MIQVDREFLTYVSIIPIVYILQTSIDISSITDIEHS